MEKRLRTILEKCEERNGIEKGKRRGWWDEKCKEKKIEMRKELRSWRKKGGGGDRYREKKREYKELYEEKKKEERERIVREAGEARTESKVWEMVRKERKGRKRVNEDIEMDEWKEYFMGLLGGVEGRVIRGGKERRGERDETELEQEEVKRVIAGLKGGKAIGRDGIPNEVWKYGGADLEEWVWEVCKRVWDGEGWPEEWKEGTIVPIVKKGRGEEAKDYRGVTLMPSLYKIYAAALGERLKEEMETKGILSESQAGFRKGMGTIDQIYALNYLINRQLGKKGGKMTAVFVDLKAAFDSVDREILIRAMRERGIREGLVVRIEEVIKETKSRVRVGERTGKEFWTARGLRQGCPLSPMLFNILLADLEEEMRRGGWGGVKLGEGKTFTLAYADDVVMMAEEEKDMRAMLSRLERYIGKKGLELNVEETKVLRFRKEGRRSKKIDWRWKGKKLEEVKQFGYLGYTIQRNGGQEAHVRERKRRAAVVMREVWGIGKRLWGKEWERRMWLYDTMVWTVMGYGAEIWGWKERKETEGIHERYLKWTMGVDWRTPGYMIRDEVKRELMRGRTGKRAWNFEKRLEEGKGGEIARRCWIEMRERWKRGRVIGGWEQERKEFLRKRGVQEGEEEKMCYETLEERDKEMQEEERMKKIGESRYNKWYRRVREKGIPEYLKKNWTESRWRRIIRFRLGNEIKEGLYWENEDKRSCKMCGREEET